MLGKQVAAHAKELAAASAAAAKDVERGYDEYFKGLPAMIQNLMIAHKSGSRLQ